MPERIQLRRTKGWRKPPGAVVVSRPSRWGNPFTVGQMIIPPVERYHTNPVYVRDRAQAVKMYRLWLLTSANRIADLVPELRGHDLACWCPLEDADGNRVPCHADVLLEVANA